MQLEMNFNYVDPTECISNLCSLLVCMSVLQIH